MDQDVTLTELFDDVVADALEQVMGSAPGRVISWNREAGTIDVQPCLARGRLVDGVRVVELVAPHKGVPVVYPGAGSYSITWPISKGDLVLLVYVSGSLDRWKHGDGAPVDAGDDRRHHPSDVVAIPGIRTIKRPVSPAPATNDLTLNSGGLIICGGSEPLVTKSEFEAHVHALLVGATDVPTTPIAGTSKLRG